MAAVLMATELTRKSIRTRQSTPSGELADERGWLKWRLRFMADRALPDLESDYCGTSGDVDAVFLMRPRIVRQICG